MNIGDMSKAFYIRDRLILAAPVLGSLCAAGLFILIVKPGFLGQMMALACASLGAAGLLLLPVVRQARLRLLKRKYPAED